MIVVKNAEELVYYPEKVRYIWPRIIAKEWLSRCEEVVHRGGTEFLEFLSEHTLIGEYCGNPEYQHVTRYERVSIIFYAIVPNNSAEKCLPVDFARKFFT
jgi:hypothetical protein